MIGSIWDEKEEELCVRALEEIEEDVCGDGGSNFEEEEAEMYNILGMEFFF